jgi:hypothetical protein
MFAALSDKLQVALGDLRDRGMLWDEDPSRAKRKICGVARPSAFPQSGKTMSPDAMPGPA